MSEKTFTVEIGTEELPPKALRSPAESSLRTSLLSWITLARRTVKLSGLLRRVVWR